jgi:hypothetical protein
MITESIYNQSNQLIVRWNYTYDPLFPDKITSRISTEPSFWQGARYEYHQPGAAVPAGALKRMKTIRTDGTTEDSTGVYNLYNSKGQLTSFSTELLETPIRRLCL